MPSTLGLGMTKLLMTKDEKGINLLPHDIAGGSSRKKKGSSPASFEYTNPEDESFFAKASKDKKEKKPGFFSRLFGRSKKSKASRSDLQDKREKVQKEQKKTRDLPVGKPLPSLLFSNSNKANNQKKSIARPLSTPQKLEEKKDAAQFQKKIEIKPLKLVPIVKKKPTTDEEKVQGSQPKAGQPLAERFKVQSEDKKEGKKKGFFVRLKSIFSRKSKSHKKKHHKSQPLPSGKPLPSAMFKGAVTHVPKKKLIIEYTSPKVSQSIGVEAQKVHTLHNPDFLHTKPLKKIDKDEIHKKEKKPSLLRRIFSRKKKKQGIPTMKSQKALQIKPIPIIRLKPESSFVNSASVATSAKGVASEDKKEGKKITDEEKVQGSQPKAGQPLAERFKVQSEDKKEGKKKGFFSRIFKRKSKKSQEQKKQKPILHKQILESKTGVAPNLLSQTKPTTDSTTDEEKVQGSRFKVQGGGEEKKKTTTDQSKEIKEKEKAESTTVGAILSNGKKGLTQAPVHKKDSHDVNLLSAEYSQRFVQGNPKKALAISVVSVVLIIGLTYAALHLYQTKSQSKVDEVASINTALAETIATYKDLENEDKDLARKISAIKKLLDNHIAWKSFLDRLEEQTIPEITYISMGASTKGTIVISALAKDFTGIARQITVLQEHAPWADKVSMTSASLAEGDGGEVVGVAFDMVITINIDALEYE